MASVSLAILTFLSAHTNPVTRGRERERQRERERERASERKFFEDVEAGKANRPLKAAPGDMIDYLKDCS